MVLTGAQYFNSFFGVAIGVVNLFLSLHRVVWGLQKNYN